MSVPFRSTAPSICHEGGVIIRQACTDRRLSLSRLPLKSALKRGLSPHWGNGRSVIWWATSRAFVTVEAYLDGLERFSFVCLAYYGIG